MPNLSDFRRLDWARDKSDNELVLEIAQRTNQAPDLVAYDMGLDPSVFTSNPDRNPLAAGLSSGLDALQGVGWSALGAGADAIGWDSARDYANNAAKDNNVEGYFSGRPDLERIEDQTLGSALPYAGYQIAKQVPMLGAALGATLTPIPGDEVIAYGALGRSLASAPRMVGGGGLKAGAGFAERRAALETGQNLAQSAYRSTAAMYPMGVGSLYQESVDAGDPNALGAMVGGVPYAMLESALPTVLKGTIGHTGGAFTGNFLSRVGKAAALDGTGEAGVELLQNEMEMGFNPNLTAEEQASRRLNSAVAGGLVGGSFGSLGGLRRRYTQEEVDLLNQQGETQPGAQPGTDPYTPNYNLVTEETDPLGQRVNAAFGLGGRRPTVDAKGSAFAQPSGVWVIDPESGLERELSNADWLDMQGRDVSGQEVTGTEVTPITDAYNNQVDASVEHDLPMPRTPGEAVAVIDYVMEEDRAGRPVMPGTPMHRAQTLAELVLAKQGLSYKPAKLAPQKVKGAPAPVEGAGGMPHFVAAREAFVSSGGSIKAWAQFVSKNKLSDASPEVLTRVLEDRATNPNITKFEPWIAAFEAVGGEDAITKLEERRNEVRRQTEEGKSVRQGQAGLTQGQPVLQGQEGAPIQGQGQVIPKPAADAPVAEKQKYLADVKAQIASTLSENELIAVGLVMGERGSLESTDERVTGSLRAVQSVIPSPRVEGQQASHEHIRKLVKTGLEKVYAEGARLGHDEEQVNAIMGMDENTVAEMRTMSESEVAQIGGMSYRKGDGPSVVRAESDDFVDEHGYERADDEAKTGVAVVNDIGEVVDAPVKKVGEDAPLSTASIDGPDENTDENADTGEDEDAEFEDDYEALLDSRVADSAEFDWNELDRPNGVPRFSHLPREVRGAWVAYYLDQLDVDDSAAGIMHARDQFIKDLEVAHGRKEKARADSAKQAAARDTGRSTTSAAEVAQEGGEGKDGAGDNEGQAARVEPTAAKKPTKAKPAAPQDPFSKRTDALRPHLNERQVATLDRLIKRFQSKDMDVERFIEELSALEARVLPEGGDDVLHSRSESGEVTNPEGKKVAPANLKGEVAYWRNASRIARAKAKAARKEAADDLANAETAESRNPPKTNAAEYLRSIAKEYNDKADALDAEADKYDEWVNEHWDNETEELRSRDADKPKPTTVGAIKRVLKSVFGKYAHSRVHIYQSIDEAVAAGALKSSKDGKDRAWVSLNKNTKQYDAFFIADNISPGEELAVFLHEVGAHFGIRNILGTDNFNRLALQIKKWATNNDGSLEHWIAKEALARVRSAQKAGDKKDVGTVSEERIAYFIETAVEAGVTPTALKGSSEFHRWFRAIYAALKGVLRKIGFYQFDKLTTQNMVDLAYGAARLELSGTWHGTASDFRKFNHDYMGTGEGAQAFGWGTYLAQRVGIAKGYWEADVRRKGFGKKQYLYDGKPITPSEESDVPEEHVAMAMADGFASNPVAAIRYVAANHRASLAEMPYLSSLLEGELVLTATGQRVEIDDDSPYVSVSRDNFVRLNVIVTRGDGDRDYIRVPLGAISRKHRPDTGIGFSDDVDFRRISKEYEETDFVSRVRALDPAKFTSVAPSAGSLMRVDVNVQDDELLDWDKPLSEQESVLAKLAKHVSADAREFMEERANSDLADMTGRELIGTKENPGVLVRALSYDYITDTSAAVEDALREGNEYKAASEYLDSIGIKGIKFLDAQSRNKPSGLKAAKIQNAKDNIQWYEKAIAEGEATLKEIAGSQNKFSQTRVPILQASLEASRTGLADAKKTLAELESEFQDQTRNIVVFNDKNIVRVLTEVGADRDNIKFSRAGAKSWALKPDGDGFKGDEFTLKHVQQSRHLDDVTHYDVYDNDDMPVAFVSVRMQGGKPAAIVNIQVVDQGQQWGEKIVRALVDTAPAEGLYINDMSPGAVGFWKKMGVLPEQGGVWDHGNGTITKERYRDARATKVDSAEDQAGSEAAPGVDGYSVEESDGEGYTFHSRRAAADRAWGAVANKLDAANRGSATLPKLLTLHQLKEVFGKKLKALAAHVELTDRMSMAQQRLMREGHQVTQEWVKLHKATMKRLHRVMLDATMKGIHPDVAFNDKSNAHLGEDSREAYEALKAAYNAMPPQAKAVYQSAKQHLAKTWEMRKTLFTDVVTAAYNKRIAEYEEAGDGKQVARLTKQRDTAIRDHNNQVDSIVGPYFPLMRFGDYVVVSKSDALREAEEANNAETVAKLRKSASHYRVEVFQSLREAEQRAAATTKPGFTTDAPFKAEQFNAHMRPMASDSLEQIAHTVSSQFDGKTATKIKDLMTELYVSSLPEHAALQRQLKREGIDGASDDMLRAFGEVVEKDSFFLSRMEYSKDIADNMFKLKAEARAAGTEYQHVYDNLAERLTKDVEYQHTPVQNFLTKASGVFHLGMAPAFLLTNMTQPWMITVPQLAGTYGMARTFGAVRNAFGDAARVIKAGKGGVFNLNDVNFDALKGEEADLLRYIADLGQLDITQNADMGLLAEGMSPKWYKGMKVFNWATHHIELHNRVTTALAAYRLAKSRDADPVAARKIALDAVVKTQLDYSGTNAAYFMRQGVGPLGNMSKVVYQFRKYQQGMLYLLFRNASLAFKGDTDAMKSLGYLMSMQLAFAGAVGIPLLAPSLAVAGLFFDDDDEEGDVETQIRNYLADMLGEDAARALWKGLPTLLGIDVSKNLGMGDLLKPLPMLRTEDVTDAKSGKAAIGTIAAEILGGTGGMAAALIDASLRGEITPALPRMLRNPVKAAAYATDGLSTRSGTKVFEADEFDGWDLTIRGLGFSTTKESEHYAAQSAKSNTSAAIKDRKSDLLKDYAVAKLNGDDVSGINDQINDYNADHPGSRITYSSKLKAVQNRKKGSDSMDEAGVAFSKDEQSLRGITGFAGN